MWKLLVGFVIFAALALYILSRGGDIDMGGEKHDVQAGHAEPAASVAAEPASAAASVAASAASN